MASRNRKGTSLWAVIEGMQLQLEEMGLEREVVDAAVTQRLTALLASDAPSLCWPWPLASA